MKKKKLLAALALACGTAFAAGLAACGHEHTFSDKWSQSETEHWHEATCEHTGEKSGLGTHTDGNKDEKCDVCGYDMHVHKFSDGWESDETGHWHPATCGHEEVKDGFAAHVDSDNDGKCDTCEYEPIDVTVGGTYYCFENGTENKELYIVFKNGKWSDDDGLSGDYKIFGNTVTLYTVISNEKIEFADGKVTGDDIVMDILGADITYRKGEDLDPTKPKDKTLSYALNDDRTYYIVNGIGGLTGDIIIPDEYKNKPVKEIAENAFANCAALTSVEIGDGVEKIGKKAFYNCTALTTVKLGEKVAKIEESTFEKCKVLKSVTVSASVKAIDDKSFTGCSALENIYYTGTASDWAQIDFYYSLGSYSSTIANPLYSSNGNRKLYIGNQLLTDADLSNAAEIKPTAFYGCKQLKSVTTGGNLRTIGEYAFYGCTEITSLTLENGLTEIGVSAFNRCGNLASVSLPDSVKIIGKSAFNECENLTYAKIGNGVTYIAYGAFMGCENLSTLILGNSVAEIGEGAFYSCNSLSSVTIPASAIFIGKEAFMYTGLTEATFLNTSGWVANKSDALTDSDLSDKANAAKLLVNSVLDNGYAEAEIEKPTLQYTLSSDKTYYILSNAGSVTRSELVIPEKYKEIPVRALADNAFANCKSLKSISLPGCMKSIPKNAFSGCSSLESIEVRGYLSGGYEEVYASADGVLYNADYSSVIFIPAAKTEVKLSASIGNSTFANNLNLKKIVLTGGKSIGENAFSGCANLVEVILPDSLTEIGRKAFNGCTSLEKITIGSGLNSVEYNAFKGCNKLTDVSVADGISLQSLSSLLSSVIVDGGWSPHTYLKDIISYNEYGGGLYLGNESNPYVALIKPANTDVKSVRIHADTQFIIGEAFYECDNLTKVIMQNGLTAIGRYAFYNCENLTDVSVPDSVAFIGEYAFENCEKLKFNKDNENKYLGNASNPYAALIKANENTEILALHKDAKVIAADALNNCGSIKEISIPDGLTSIDTAAINRGTLEKITVSNKNEVYSSQDGILYNKEMTEIILVPYSIKGEIVVPDTITDLGTHFKERANITAITLHDGITAIEDSAFYNCSLLAEIELPDGVTVINNSAFYNCSSLTIINIPSGVTEIGYSAFNGCTALEEVHITDLAKWCSIKFNGNPLSAGHNLYINGEAVVNLPIPSSVTAISANAFTGASIESVSIPSSVKTIGGGAFKDCASLSSVTLNSGITYIGATAFEGCVSLESVTFPDSLTEIGKEAFKGCTALDKVYIKDLTKWCQMTLGYNAFDGYSLYLNGKELTELTIPSSVTAIGSYTFANCKSITSVTIEDGVKAIYRNAFSRCINLKTATVPNSVTSYGYDVFGSCNSMESMTLPLTCNFGFWFGGSTSYADNSQYVPQSLKTIIITGGLKSYSEIYVPENAFLNCKYIENVILPDCLTRIYKNTFSGCDSLTSLTLPFVGERADGSGQTAFKFLFGDYVSDIPKTLKNVTVKGGTLVEDAFENCASIESMDIRDGVTKIAQYAFKNCKFTNLTIANGVKNVDKRALVFVSCENLTVHADVITAVYGISPSVLSYDLKTLTITGGNAKAYHSTDGDPLCGFDDCPNLTKVVFKSGVTQIGDRILDMTNCPNNSLSEIVIEEGATSIGEYAFMHCDKLTDIVLPDSVTNIGHAAFADCSSLTTVTIGKNMKNIDDFAFTGCNAITDINYNGTKSQWNAIKKDSWISYSAKYTVHCTDGDIAKK